MSDVLKTLTVMAEIYGRALSKDAAKLLLSDLAGYSEKQILLALQRCRRELPRFPTLAEIVERIDDGRPGVEEAWAMVPKSEDESVVWTEEMATAFSAAAPLIGEDNVAARLAFKESYAREVRRARDEKRLPKWSTSLGHDKRHRESMLNEAVMKCRISLADAKRLIPEMPMSGQSPKVLPSGVAELIKITFNGKHPA